jgi:glycosyltransferase involved in cell wall biosynthesis
MMMNKFTYPEWVERHNFQYDSFDQIPHETIVQLREKLRRFMVEQPEVSIVIPAYNEETELLKSLSSFAELEMPYKCELIVANNNSTDRTQELLDSLGVKSVFQPQQGVSHARQAGLEAAEGIYILNGDADSIYAPDWGTAHVEILKKYPDVTCVYGRYSFVPTDDSPRFRLALHELAAETAYALRSKGMEPASVRGCNFAYRKADALKVGGFKHHLDRLNTDRCEDGWMALELSELGKIHYLGTSNQVWTSSRRLLENGSLFKASYRRLKLYLREFYKGEKAAVDL